MWLGFPPSRACSGPPRYGATQFNRVIQSSSYRALVDKLKAQGG